jgi:nucleoside-diphosphate-sugar epimerase
MTEHEEELETQVEDGGEIITLFGIDGPVGRHFVKLALSAGYHIQALSSSSSSSSSDDDDLVVEHECLTVVKGDLDSVSESVLCQLLQNATHVVCLLSDSTPKKDYPEGLLFNFIQRLYPLVKESPVRVFLYQVSSRSGCYTAHTWLVFAYMHCI